MCLYQAIHKHLEWSTHLPSSHMTQFVTVQNRPLCYHTGIDDHMYHRERILETSTLSCNEEEEEITKPPKR